MVEYNTKIKTIIGSLAVAIVAVLFGLIVNINFNQNGEIEVTTTTPEAVIEYSAEPVPATITKSEETIEGVETGQGAVGEQVPVETVDGYPIPTVEAVESNGPVTEDKEQECPEGEECGRGATYPQVDISTPQAFLNQTLGGCYDVDGYYNEQCWDYAALYFLNYTGHTFYTCGTGAAKGAIADGCWQKNAGNEFTMIWDATQLQAGDWIVFNNGTFGHVGMAVGTYNNGYITLAGQNQGGGLCPGSTMGARVNLINISLKYFAGAFRPNIYIPPEPEPEPEPKPTVDVCRVREVVKGDTLGKIMKECTGETKWGATMNEYASHWYSTKFQRYLTVYDGWASLNGVGLFAGDVIEYRD